MVGTKDSGKEVDIDQALLEETAREIYMQLTKGRMRGFDPAVIASRAFSEAKAFCLEAMAIRNGKSIADLTQDEEPLFARVNLWDGSRGLHGEPIKDENGKAVTEIQPVDRYASAPNLDPSHPINQRYLPNAIRNKALVNQDGTALDQNKLAALVAANN